MGKANYQYVNSNVIGYIYIMIRLIDVCVCV